MEDMFGDFGVSGELKNYIKAQVFGDILVDVRVEFRPQWIPSDPNDKIALDMVNARLRMVSGEISHTVREIIKEKLKLSTEDSFGKGLK